MEKVIRTVNGVDVRRLKETIMAVKEQPDLARFRFRAHNEWIDGGHNRSTVQGFYGTCQEDNSRLQPFILHNDEPDVLLGADNGPNPVENLLHALAGCLTTSMVYHAAARGYKVDKIESSLEGNIDLRGFLGLDPSVRNGYRNINITFRIEGDLTPEQKQEIVNMGPMFSPVYDSVSQPVPVNVRLAID